jgi:hypothetical protein
MSKQNAPQQFTLHQTGATPGWCRAGSVSNSSGEQTSLGLAVSDSPEELADEERRGELATADQTG